MLLMFLSQPNYAKLFINLIFAKGSPTNWRCFTTTYRLLQQRNSKTKQRC